MPRPLSGEEAAEARRSILDVLEKMSMEEVFTPTPIGGGDHEGVPENRNFTQFLA